MRLARFYDDRKTRGLEVDLCQLSWFATLQSNWAKHKCRKSKAPSWKPLSSTQQANISLLAPWKVGLFTQLLFLSFYFISANCSDLSKTRACFRGGNGIYLFFCFGHFSEVFTRDLLWFSVFVIHRRLSANFSSLLPVFFFVFLTKKPYPAMLLEMYTVLSCVAGCDAFCVACLL